MRAGYVFAIALAAAIFGYWLHGFFAQDACLDAGGAWDARRSLCIGVE